MEATANTGFVFTVGYSMKQGTQQLHDTVVELDNAIGQLLNLSNYKLIFIMLPQYIRKFIPLKYWPSEYQYYGPKLKNHHISASCESVSGFYDFVFDCIDRHAEVRHAVGYEFVTLSPSFTKLTSTFLEFQLGRRVCLPTGYNAKRFFTTTICLFRCFPHGLDVINRSW